MATAVRWWRQRPWIAGPRAAGLLFLYVPPAGSLPNAFMNLELFLLLALGEGTKAEVLPERWRGGCLRRSAVRGFWEKEVGEAPLPGVS